MKNNLKYRKKKLVFIDFTYLHHKGTHGGYQHIKDYLPYDYIIDCQKWFEISYREITTITKRIQSKVVRIFPLFILKCIGLSLMHRDIVFHFAYTENLFVPMIKLLPKRAKIVCTIHQPYNWFSRSWLVRLKRADKIILVGNTEIYKFQKVFPNNKVIFIPHGIDTTFYHPSERKTNDKLSLLTVGNWLRDYAFANEVYKELLSKYSNVEINIVASCVTKKDFVKDDRIHVWRGVPDDKLRELYQKSNCLFLPLKRFTANNALLEAASCGCNILIASNHNDNSYIPEKYIHTCTLEQSACVKEICSIITSTSANSALRQYVIDHYDWKKIGQITRNILLNV